MIVAHGSQRIVEPGCNATHQNTYESLLNKLSTKIVNMTHRNCASVAMPEIAMLQAVTLFLVSCRRRLTDISIES